MHHFAPPTLALIHDLAAAIALRDPERVGLAVLHLAGAIGNTEALEIAVALALEARPLAVIEAPGLTRCA